jgi:hypothetical protein
VVSDELAAPSIIANWSRVRARNAFCLHDNIIALLHFHLTLDLTQTSRDAQLKSIDTNYLFWDDEPEWWLEGTVVAKPGDARVEYQITHEMNKGEPNTHHKYGMAADFRERPPHCRQSF